jgi:hypothetical protein
MANDLVSKINKDFIIEDLLDQNKKLMNEKATQVGLSQTLLAENKSFLEYAKDLEKKVESLEAELNKERSKKAGPVPVKEVIDHE